MKTTQWSVVLAAGGEGEGARAALEQLCRTYRQPAYAFIRRQRQPEDALELTQEFFTQVLERRDLARLDPLRGRFRSWLFGSLATRGATICDLQVTPGNSGELHCLRRMDDAQIPMARSAQHMRSPTT